MPGQHGLTEEERFWSKVAVGAPGECWEWKRSRLPRGYGRFRQPTGHEYAHRVAWRLTNGPIPDGMVVRHYVCDNPPCCNPAHLRLGTQGDNNDDSVSRGRWGYRGMPGNQNARKKPGEGKRAYRKRGQ